MHIERRRHAIIVIRIYCCDIGLQVKDVYRHRMSSAQIWDFLPSFVRDSLSVSMLMS